MKQKIACNISPIKDLVEPVRTFEEIVSEKQGPIELKLSLAELAAELCHNKSLQENNALYIALGKP